MYSYTIGQSYVHACNFGPLSDGRPVTLIEGRTFGPGGTYESVPTGRNNATHYKTYFWSIYENLESL